MAITALPEGTTHLLGSAQVLTTPTSLIKELIDNSLDAKATSIDILISANTIDKLEVRDNGHGIPQEDLNALGKRGYTSKLRSFEELKLLGGVTLGFRGEALASAVQMGEVSITTRTDGESVATKVKLKAPGRIEDQCRTSHPVGTTVSVLNFMAKLPVRRKTFEKDAAKTVIKINHLLQAYALARPCIKFSLKIAKGGKGSWSYVPRPNGDIRVAVSQVIGKDTAMQCIEKSFEFSGSRTGKESTVEQYETGVSTSDSVTPRTSQRDHFTIEAFLPVAQADPSKIGNGQYLSVDTRPVSHEKGTMKKIVTLYKKYIRGALAETSSKVKNPFIRLNVKCPIASYDANVEPAKDDVLFGNESILLELIESLFKDVYGECKADRAVSVGVLSKNFNDFELLLAKTPLSASNKEPCKTSMTVQLPPLVGLPVPVSPSSTDTSAVEANEGEVDNDIGEQAGNKKRKWQFDMSTDYNEEVIGFEKGSHTHRLGKQNSDKYANTEMGSSVRNDLNPWLIAKMNAPSTGNVESSSGVSKTAALRFVTPGSRPRPVSDHIVSSTPSPRPRQNICHDAVGTLQRSVAMFSRPQVFPNSHTEEPTLFRRSEALTNHDGEADLVDDVDRSNQLTDGNGLDATRNAFEMFPISPPATLAPRGAKKQRGHNRPFISALEMVQNGAALYKPMQTELPEVSLQSRTRTEVDHTVEQIDTSSDLAWAMEFEERKEAATRQRRDELRSTRLPNDESFSPETHRLSPHKNRYNAAIASLETGQQKESFKTSLPDDDPRAYLMWRQKSMASRPVKSGDLPKLMRTKSSKLPMERIPRDAELYHLLQALPVDMPSLRRVTSSLLVDDTYISRGTQDEGLSEDIFGITRRLQEIVKNWVSHAGGKGYEVEFISGNLANLNSVDVA